MPIPWQQHPEELQTYLVDFGARLAGDQIVGEPVIVPEGSVVAADVEVTPSPGTGAAAAAVKFTLTGGSAGDALSVICRVTTATGQTIEAVPLLDIL